MLSDEFRPTLDAQFWSGKVFGKYVVNSALGTTNNEYDPTSPESALLRAG